MTQVQASILNTVVRLRRDVARLADDAEALARDMTGMRLACEAGLVQAWAASHRSG